MFASIPSPSLPCISPQWPCPSNVSAVVTTRLGGVSASPYNSLNLGEHVGDDPNSVAANWQRVINALSLPEAPQLLQQVHGTTVVRLPPLSPGSSSGDIPLKSQCGDAVYTQQVGRVCTVLSADCLPILLCNRQGTEVAAVHAGWRGLAAGVVSNAVKTFQSSPGDLLAWLGPAIGPNHFEVGQEVFDAFSEQNSWGSAAISACFSPQPSQGKPRWLANLVDLAKLSLRASGVTRLFGGELCTYSEPQSFFSYRREGVTGRMASLIWLNT